MSLIYWKVRLALHEKLGTDSKGLEALNRTRKENSFGHRRGRSPPRRIQETIITPVIDEQNIGLIHYQLYQNYLNYPTMKKIYWQTKR